MNIADISFLTLCGTACARRKCFKNGSKMICMASSLAMFFVIPVRVHQRGVDINCIQNIMRISEVAQNLWSLTLGQRRLPMLMRDGAL